MNFMNIMFEVTNDDESSFKQSTFVIPQVKGGTSND